MEARHHRFIARLEREMHMAQPLPGFGQGNEKLIESEKVRRSGPLRQFQCDEDGSVKSCRSFKISNVEVHVVDQTAAMKLHDFMLPTVQINKNK